MTTATAEPLPELTNDELGRYSRHLILPEVGMEGQQRLKAAKVLCVGTGGLGSPLALYLAAAGIGTLGVIDFDVVDYSNLQRQIIHSTKDVGRKKVDSAQEKLNALNPALNVVKHDTMLTSANALEIFAQYDIIADGTDNFQTRYLVNDACVLLNKPNAYGSIFRFEGQASVFATKDGPCYRCLYPEPPPPGLVPSCAEGGVLGILPGMIGTIQATEVIKLILGKGEPLIGRLLLVDALTMRFRELKLRKNPDCPVCGTNPTVTALIDYNQFCGIAPEPAQAATVKNGIPQISVKELKARLDGKEARNDNFLLLDVREPYEFQIAQIGGKLIPQNDVPNRLNELNPQQEIFVHCRSGARSQKIAEFLQANGFQKVSNVAGGILAWADEIDTTVQKY
ncbi:molybdopterin-synthase adenylyltransferase MoeB [Acidicapsa ligni]|uniref:molybdopterin-synthase adenylyltransferase MoeB n=1 Tax=Acidicapsa ligni TaxID=542300 RepID=UPI0021E02839|nr:molybdopterin-synthase adenylyltransferase MoeB [Acidicapsa ligni]